MISKYILCPNCEKTLSAEAGYKYCRYCGAELQNKFKYTGKSLTDLVENAIKELNEKEYNDPLYVQHNYEFTLTHDGLNKHRLFKGKNLRELYQKALMQARAWDGIWNEKQAKESRKQEAEIKRLELEEIKHQEKISKERAEKEIQDKIISSNKKYEDIFNSLNNILVDVLNNDSIYDWNKLKDFSQFEKPEPIKPILMKPSIPNPVYPEEPKLPFFANDPKLLSVYEEPKIDDPKYQVKLNIFYKLFKWFYNKRKDAALEKYKHDHELWLKDKQEITIINEEEKAKWLKEKNHKEQEYSKNHEKWLKAKEEVHKEYKDKKKALEEEYKDKFNEEYITYDKQLIEWESERDLFYKNQKIINDAIDNKIELYKINEKESIVEYYRMALNSSNYPISYNKYFEIDFLKDSKTIIINYLLPLIDDIPNVKQLKYIKSKNEFQKIFLTSSEHNKIYDNVLYMISLRTIYEIFYGDKIGAIDSVVFNGWIKVTDKSTGQEIQKCILSLQAKKEEFSEINLYKIDPKTCFIHLKGVSASKLYDLVPIAPIMDMDKHDKRFISSYEVAASLDESVNIAVMDWQDFEHLIREIFEKEFQQSGGEVKITRASRDAGVDAIAFDPDPIRGGKIVIQAKRYVNIVGVAAVRDLYGTVINEGATKGILVTTSNYGSDAHEFARGKPISLLNGSHLLHLLERHGYKAKIDLNEAKQVLSEQES